MKFFTINGPSREGQQTGSQDNNQTSQTSASTAHVADLHSDAWRFNLEPSRRVPSLASITHGMGQPRNLSMEIAIAHGEQFRIHKIIGDGKCMFRATVRSLAMHKGVHLRPRDELLEAEQLRAACHDALCRTSQRSKEFPDARKQILYGYGDLDHYCHRLAKPSFWGGEVEMMVISKMLKIPIFVYTSQDESQNGAPREFKITAKFGEKFRRKQDKGREPVHLLYTGGNHFDLLTPH